LVCRVPSRLVDPIWESQESDFPEIEGTKLPAININLYKIDLSNMETRHVGSNPARASFSQSSGDRTFAGTRKREAESRCERGLGAKSFP
jgi:hypothetical protein